MRQTRAATKKQDTPFLFTDLPRSAGILLHITSLPSPFGIGDMGPGAKAFADFLSQSGQTYWQLLPLNPTSAGMGNSPYSANSSMAGNPLLISPQLLIADGLLTEEEVTPYRIKDTDKVDYNQAETTKYALLDKAYVSYTHNSASLQKEFNRFDRGEKYWLDDYALYTILKKEHEDRQWSDWADAYKQRNPKALKRFAKAHANAINKEKWLQFMFSRQWHSLRTYCNNLNIRLFGDMPIYVAYDSADVWAHRDNFSIDAAGKPLFVAGTPPDVFSENGQLWGMPVFKWKALKQQGYKWWINRLRKNLELFDLLRLDHFRAFAAYWQVKAGSETAANGEWINAPGKEFFTVLKKELGEMPFVAEDLGHIDEPVYKLRDGFKLPGMNVLHFAFVDDMAKSPYIPYHHRPVSVVYTGTHDNDTTIGWFKTLPKEAKKRFHQYTGQKINANNVCDILCRMCYASVSKLAVLPMQDVLELDEKARMNTPSSGDKNWGWRMLPDQMNESVMNKLIEWCTVYDRMPE